MRPHDSLCGRVPPVANPGLCTICSILRPPLADTTALQTVRGLMGLVPVVSQPTPLRGACKGGSCRASYAFTYDVTCSIEPPLAIEGQGVFMTAAVPCPPATGLRKQKKKKVCYACKPVFFKVQIDCWIQMYCSMLSDAASKTCASLSEIIRTRHDVKPRQLRKLEEHLSQ